MKQEVVSAIVPANAEKGTAEISASVTVNYGETAEESIAMFGADAVNSNAFANWRVTLQANIRGALKRGEAPESIAARLSGAKMGVAATGAKIDPVQAYLAAFQNATPEKQAEMLKELKERAKKA